MRVMMMRRCVVFSMDGCPRLYVLYIYSYKLGSTRICVSMYQYQIMKIKLQMKYAQKLKSEDVS